MDVSDVLRAQKSDIQIGEWKYGHIPRAQFPLSKVRPKSYKFGSDYQWRVVTFATTQGKFRVLLLLNEGKGIFRATLAVETKDGDMAVLCQHEFHQSEPGWHCHVSFSSIERIPCGVFRSHLTKWPKYRQVHAEVVFSANTTSALSIAAKCFKFSAQGDLI